MGLNVDKVVIKQSSGDWMVFDDKDNPVCNFIPEVIAWVDVHTNDEAESHSWKVEPHVKLRINFQNGKVSEEFVIPLSELGRIDWTEKDVACRFHPNFSRKKAGRYLEDMIREALEDAPRKSKYILTKLGIHNIEDTIIYCAGSLFVQASGVSGMTNAGVGMAVNNDADAGAYDIESPFDIELGSFSQRLAIDLDRYPEKDAIAGMIKLIDLNPDVGRTLIAHTISGLMRSVYLAVGITPRTVLKVAGDKGMFKTTYTSFMTQLYDREKKDDIKPATRLNASPPFIEKILHEYRDSVVVLDDLHPSEIKEIAKKNETTLEEMIRRIGDGTGRGHMRGNKRVEQPPNCNVIITGEYIYGKGSTAARMLVVELKEVIDSVELQECQDEPLLVSTFFYYFILWYVSNYHEIQKSLSEWLNDFRGRASLIGVNARLNETFFCLNTGFAMFLQYCFERDFISDEEAEETLYSFQELLVELIYAQHERIERSDDIGSGMTSKSNMLDIIRQLYKGNKFHLSVNAQSFVEGEHDGVIHCMKRGTIRNSYLCLRSDRLEPKVRLLIPDIDINHIIKDLWSKGALETDKKGMTKQLNGARNKRFLWIPLSKLR